MILVAVAVAAALAGAILGALVVLRLAPTAKPVAVEPPRRRAELVPVRALFADDAAWATASALGDVDVDDATRANLEASARELAANAWVEGLSDMRTALIDASGLPVDLAVDLGTQALREVERARGLGP